MIMLKSPLPNQLTICWLCSTFLLHKLCNKKCFAHKSYFVRLSSKWVHVTYFKSNLIFFFFFPQHEFFLFYHNLLLSALVSFWHYQLPNMLSWKILRKVRIILYLGWIEHMNAQLKWENILKADYISFKQLTYVSWACILKRLLIPLILNTMFYLTPFIFTTKCDSVQIHMYEDQW